MEEYHFYSEVDIFVSEYHDEVYDILNDAGLDYLVEKYDSRGGILTPSTILRLKDTTTSAECDEIVQVLEDRGLTTQKI